MTSRGKIAKLIWGYGGSLGHNDFGSDNSRNIEGQIEVIVSKLNEVIEAINELTKQEMKKKGKKL